MASLGSSPTALFDRRAWRAHRNRAAAGAVDFLHDEIGDRLLDRLDLVNRDFPDVLDLGARERRPRRAGSQRGRARRGSSWPNRRPGFSPGQAARASRPIPSWCRFATPASISSSAIWCCIGPPTCPARWFSCAARCEPDGLLLAAMLGGQTLVELRTALFEAELEEEGGVSPRVSPSIELGDAAALLQRAGLCAAGRRQRDDHGRPIPICWR